MRILMIRMANIREGNEMKWRKRRVVLAIFCLGLVWNTPAAMATDSDLEFTGNKPGSRVYAGVHYRNGKFVQETAMTDATGYALIRVHDQEEVDIYILARIPLGATQPQVGIVLTSGGSLQYEPFSIPGFFPTNHTESAGSVIDVATFLSEGDPFFEG